MTTPSPFDPKTVLLAKHAQHVVLIHFPIALFIAGAAFDFLAQRTKRREFAAAACYNLVAAAVTAIPVMVTGILAWQWALEGQKLKGVLLMHLALAWVSSILIWIVAFIHLRTHRKPQAALPGYRLAIEACAVAVIIVTAHLGGFLSGVNS